MNPFVDTTGKRLVAMTAIASATWVAVMSSAAPAAQAATRTVTCRHATSDAAAIQSVIAASNKGDEIVLAGRCLITSTIQLRGSRSYRGESDSTTLTAAENSNLRAVLASASWWTDSPTTGEPTSLRTLTVDANKAKNPTGGDGVIIRSWRTTIDGITVKNARGSGLLITNRSRNNKALTNSQVNGVIRNVFIEASGRHGISVSDDQNTVTDWNLLDSWISRSGGDAIRLGNAAGWTVAGNHVYHVTGTGITADRLYGSSIRDNYVEDFGKRGIEVTVQDEVASTIARNRVFQLKGSGSTYLAVTRVNQGTGQLAVTGNTIRGKGVGIGISYRAGDHRLRVASSGNSIHDVAKAVDIGPGVTVDNGM